jgi:hypothetical protein
MAAKSSEKKGNTECKNRWTVASQLRSTGPRPYVYRRMPPPVRNVVTVRDGKWLFVFNSDSLRMNQDHRSAGETNWRFDHPPGA